jgi:transcriptional regulator with PAS, ATPase and Fis domain
MRSLRDTLARAAGSELRVLLAGEPGTGKELAAREVHARSARAKSHFVGMNCAAIPDGLFESELFGTVKGAYPGAVDRPGRVELAEGGTLFLDEVGELGPAVQAKVLRLLQEQEYERLGDPRTRKADVRVVSATNRPLEQMKRDGKFRQDLLDRLNGVTVRLPPLREHLEDLGVMVGRLFPGLLGDGALDALKQYGWPGNVRELRNVLERLVVFSDDRTNVTAADVQRELQRNGGDFAAPAARLPVDCAALKDALQRTGGNRAQAARLLNISRRTLYNKIEACGL